MSLSAIHEYRYGTRRVYGEPFTLALEVRCYGSAS
jgi:hypothetical protein